MSTQVQDYDPLLSEHDVTWDEKPTLRTIYLDYHRRLLEQCPPGPLLDIGGGTAHVKSIRPDVLSVDILPFPGIDVACDAHELPFKDGEFSGIMMLDVLHHLREPVVFLKEAARVLKPGGCLAMIEPGMSWASYPFFKYVHQEPAELSADPFAPIGGAGDEKDPWDSNQAVPTLLFGRPRITAELFRRVPEFSLSKVDWLSLFAYPLSGGFKKWCLLPNKIAPSLIALEDRVPLALKKRLAFRLFVVLKRA